MFDNEIPNLDGASVYLLLVLLFMFSTVSMIMFITCNHLKEERDEDESDSDEEEVRNKKYYDRRDYNRRYYDRLIVVKVSVIFFSIITAILCVVDYWVKLEEHLLSEHNRDVLTRVFFSLQMVVFTHLTITLNKVAIEKNAAGLSFVELMCSFLPYAGGFVSLHFGLSQKYQYFISTTQLVVNIVIEYSLVERKRKYKASMLQSSLLKTYPQERVEKETKKSNEALATVFLSTSFHVISVLFAFNGNEIWAECSMGIAKFCYLTTICTLFAFLKCK